MIFVVRVFRGRRSSQAFHFRSAQRTPCPLADAFELERADGDAQQRQDLVVEPREHAADFAVLALGQNDFQDRHVAAVGHDSGAAGSHLAFGQPDAFRQLVDDFMTGIASDRHPVGLLHAVTRVSQPLGQGPVVRQEHQPFAVTVKPADDEDAFTRLRHQVKHKGTPRGIVGRADITLRLVDEIIDVRFDFDPLAVHRNFRDGRVDLRAEFPDDFAVDGHPAFEDEHLARATGPHAGLSQNLVQPLGIARFIDGWRRGFDTARHSGFRWCGACGIAFLRASFGESRRCGPRRIASVGTCRIRPRRT